MKLITQIGIVFAFCFLGEFIASILPFTFPSSLISMILLFIFLLCGVIKIKQIEDVANFLLTNMAFFFIPAGVSIITSFPVIQDKIFSLIAVTILCTIITILVTAISIKCALLIQNKLRRKC